MVFRVNSTTTVPSNSMDFDQPRIHDSTGARIACGTISLDAMTPTTTQLIDAAWWAVGPVGPVGYGWIWGVPTHGWFISWKIRKYENCGYPPWIGHLHSVLLQSWTSKIPKEMVILFFLPPEKSESLHILAIVAQRNWRLKYMFL